MHDFGSILPIYLDGNFAKLGGGSWFTINGEMLLASGLGFFFSNVPHLEEQVVLSIICQQNQ